MPHSVCSTLCSRDSARLVYLQWDTLAPYLFIIGLNYVLWTSVDLIRENSFTLKKAGRRYPAKSMTDADDVDDLALLENDQDMRSTTGEARTY